jgi:hypothetical protein
MRMQAAQEQLTISATAKLLFHIFQKFLKIEPLCHGLIMRGDV